MIVCLVWPVQAWYPHLLQLLLSNPVLFPVQNDLLLNTLRNRHPLIINNSLPLAGWRVSGITSLLRACQKKLQIFSSLPNADQQMLSTSPVGLRCCWVGKRQVDTFRPAVTDFQKGKQYSTINTYRSAISSRVPPLDRTPYGQHKIAS